MEKKNFKLLLIICLANSTVFTLPFLQNTYYQAYQTGYGFTHEQMGSLFTYFGICNLAAYIVGGILADIINTKKLFLFSLLVTGFCGFYSATIPTFEIMLALHIIWSLSTTFTFWSAMIKSIKLLADDYHQGWIFGLKETIVCVLSLVVSILGLILFNYFNEDIRSLIIFYSTICVFVGFLILILYPSECKTEKFDFKILIYNLKFLIKLKGIWLIGGLLACCVTISILIGRFTPFFNTVSGFSCSFVALLSIISTNGFANIGSYNGGKLSDSLGSAAKFICITIFLTLILTVIFLLTPWNSGMMSVIIVIFIIYRILNGALRSCYFATLTQVKIPNNMIGTASGLVSVIGYMPEAFMYSVCGNVLENNPPVQAFRLIFLMLVAVCFFGIILAIMLDRYSKKNKNI